MGVTAFQSHATRQQTRATRNRCSWRRLRARPALQYRTFDGWIAQLARQPEYLAAGILHIRGGAPGAPFHLDSRYGLKVLWCQAGGGRWAACTGRTAHPKMGGSSAVVEPSSGRSSTAGDHALVPDGWK